MTAGDKKPTVNAVQEKTDSKESDRRDEKKRSSFGFLRRFSKALRPKQSGSAVIQQKQEADVRPSEKESKMSDKCSSTESCDSENCAQILKNVQATKAEMEDLTTDNIDGPVTKKAEFVAFSKQDEQAQVETKSVDVLTGVINSENNHIKESSDKEVQDEIWEKAEENKKAKVPPSKLQLPATKATKPESIQVAAGQTGTYRKLSTVAAPTCRDITNTIGESRNSKIPGQSLKRPSNLPLKSLTLSNGSDNSGGTLHAGTKLSKIAAPKSFGNKENGARTLTVGSGKEMSESQYTFKVYRRYRPL